MSTFNGGEVTTKSTLSLSAFFIPELDFVKRFPPPCRHKTYQLLLACFRMGTRGAYGFRINEQDKVTYNHFDSYPDWLGRKVMEYVSQTPLNSMRQTASSIVLVGEETKPSADLIEMYKKYADLHVSTRKYEEWYCLLRKTQGDLFPYNDDLRHMIDSQLFLTDSLFCEWAYIVNLDSERLEVYKGFNKDLRARGRYARWSVPDNYGYKGVTLIQEVAINEIGEHSIDGLVKELEAMRRATQLVR